MLLWEPHFLCGSRCQSSLDYAANVDLPALPWRAVEERDSPDLARRTRVVRAEPEHDQRVDALALLGVELSLHIDLPAGAVARGREQRVGAEPGYLEVMRHGAGVGLAPAWVAPHQARAG